MKLSCFDYGARQYSFIQEHALANLDRDQQRALSKFVTAMGGLCWWKMGEGKSRIALFWFAMLQNHYRWSLPSVCVIVARRRAFYDWKQEIAKIFPDADVWTDDIPVFPPSKGPCFLLLSEGVLAKMVPIYARFRIIRAVIFDELWLYANPKSTKSKAAYHFGMGRKNLGLGGTIMKARDTAEVWGQARCVSKHMPLASSLTGFRSKYQITSTTSKFPSFSAKPGSYAEIMRTLEFCTDVHFPKSRMQIREQYHKVPATPQQASYFQELRDYFSIEEHRLEFNSSLATAVKAQQVSDGFVKTGEDEYVNFPTNKFEKLKDELEVIIANGDRAVVWCAFRHTVELLQAQLPFATLQMVGGIDFDVAAWERGDALVCIATEASGSSVNHFRDTPYAIYYSLNYKWKDLAQSRMRHDRKDSKHTTCYYKYLGVEDSLDDHVYRVALGSGEREQRLLMQGEILRWAKDE